MFVSRQFSVSRSLAVVVADDHHPIRHIVRHFLAKEPDMDVVGEAETGEQALHLVRTLQPDVLVLDHALPDTSASQLLEQLPPACRVLIYTGYPCAQLAQLLFSKGAAGFMAKTDDCTTLAYAVRQVARGYGYVSPRIASNLTLARAVGNPRKSAKESLEPFDFDILQHLANGLTPVEIAARMNKSERSISEHIAKICGLLGLKHRSQVTAWAAANAFGKPPIE